jgi:hypothetical protein
LEYESGGRRYQGASWTRFHGGKVTERSGSIDLKDGPYTWTFPTADREADTWTLPRAEKELPKAEGKTWFFDRNCALQLKGNWYFSENAVRGPIMALANAQTYFSKVDYQCVYVRALQPDEDYSDFIRVEPSAQVKHPSWRRYDPSSTKSLVDLQRLSAGRVRILQSKQPLP